jgi:hypothetical protein
MLQVVIPFFKFRVIKGLAGITGVIFCKVLTPKGCFVRTIFPYVADACKEALKEFNLNVEGVVALDVGVSTGGFTDCLLQAGARKVYALDVGYGQLLWKLREDKRVVVIERTNIRYYEGVDFDEQINLATIDVSFIPLKIVLPAVLISPLSLHEFSLFAFVSSEPDPTPKIVASLPRQSRAPRLSFGTPLIATSC